MKQITGNLFQPLTYSMTLQPDAMCITTNGFVKSNGECVMGRGCARTAKRYTEHGNVALNLGRAIRLDGNRVYDLGQYEALYGAHLVSFPVKPTKVEFNGHNVVNHMASKFKLGDTVPGWAAKAEERIIKRSADQLLALADSRDWQCVVLPRPGCGAGELAWEHIGPVMETILDDRFYAITFA